RATIERYLGSLRMLLEAMAADDARTIARLPLLGETERQQVLVEWNASAAAYPQWNCVHQLFEEQVRQMPDAIAIAQEDRQLSYGELNARANRLAHYMREIGAGPDSRVALCLDKSLEMIVGLLAVLKAGAAYVPLDPAYPSQRLSLMLRDSVPRALLTGRA